jgi:hypothetical protein
MSDESSSRPAPRRQWVRLFAEFGVIFLGVTLSLLADDWRQRTTDRSYERMALEELQADLEAEASDMGSLSNGTRDDASAALWIYLKLGESEINPDSLSAKLGTIYNWYVYKAARATYAGLRSTGRLTLIQDDDLRRDITTYYEERQPYIQNFYENYQDLWLTLRESMAQDVEWEMLEEADTWSARADLVLKRPWTRIPSDPLLRHHLEMVGVLGEVIATRSAEVLADNAELREAIAQALSQ